MTEYRKCPKCGSVKVCWNWVHCPIEKAMELNPHLSKGELESSQWIHECWNCGDDIGGHCFETRDEITDGIPYEELI